MGNETWSAYWYYYWYWHNQLEGSQQPGPAAPATSPTAEPTLVPSTAQATCLPKQTSYGVHRATKCKKLCSAAKGSWCAHWEYSGFQGGMCELYDCLPQWSWSYRARKICKDNWHHALKHKFDARGENGVATPALCTAACSEDESCA